MESENEGMNSVVQKL